MKTLLLLASTTLVACGSPLSPEPAGPLLVTDALVYQFTDAEGIAPSFGAVGVRIGYTFSNLTANPVALCGFNPTLERRVGSEWEPAWIVPTFGCGSPPFEIEPGWEYRNAFYVIVFPPGSNVRPRFEGTPTSGTYRLMSHDPKMPEPLRASNSFQILVADAGDTSQTTR